MSLTITNVTLSKNPVAVGEKFKIFVDVKETKQEQIMYRFPFRLGDVKGIKT